MHEKFRKLDKKKRIILALAIVLIIGAIAISVTYAFFKVATDKGSTLSEIGAYAECFDIDYGSANNINLDYQYPITDEFALANVTPVTITVTNNCKNNVKAIPYTIAITSLINDNSLPDNAIRMYVKKQVGTSAEGVIIDKSYLSDAEVLSSGAIYDSLIADLNTRNDISAYTSKNMYFIDNAALDNNTTVTYKLYLWVDYYEGDAGVYQGLEHDKSYDGSTEGKEFASAVSLIVNDMDSYEVFNVPDITINVKTNGIADVVPTSGLYIKNISCDKGSVRYDTKYNRVAFSSITSPAKCTLNYTNNNSLTNNDKLSTIVQTAGTCSNASYTTKSTCETGGGTWTITITNVNGYRYSGENPNNYVWFNNELWRIIGLVPVCTEASNGTCSDRTTNLVKIIRAYSIGGLVYDAKSSGETGLWESNTLYTLLNEYYYGRQNGTGTAYCYGYKDTAKAKCDYTKIGISSSSTDYYGKMVVDVYWNIGATNYNASASTAYGAESSKVTENKSKIGLMSASDYVYAAAVDGYDISMNSYGTSEITGTNWLYSQSNEWTNIQGDSYTNYAIVVGNTGGVALQIAYSPKAVRPVLYLDTGVYKIDGSGTMLDPYIIGM